ncbi:MAG TPA: kynureninase [Thermoleophilia bacterium]|nr:kynureninase [Thermoleophilia bacterium]
MNREERALALDAQDELADFREHFYLPPDTIYMDGNSLGLPSREAEAALLQVLDEWKRLAIGGFLQGETPWISLGERLGELQAPLVGAHPDEVVATGSTTVNLHQLVATFYQPEGRRRKVLADELNFPSDLYALQSQVRLHGLEPAQDLVLVRSRDGRTLQEDDIVAAMTDEVATVVLPSVLYRSGQLLDLERLTAEAHARGCLIGFDLCHSAGAVPHALSAWGVDFAYWCTYKYLNSGPGGIAGLYVNRRHHGRLPGLCGWWGYRSDARFAMRPEFEAAPTAAAWQIGTPTMLSAAPLLGSLALFAEAGMERLRARSLALTEYLMELVDTLPEDLGYRIGTPREPSRRGGHVAVEHPDAWRVCQALLARGVVPDFRPPDVVRLAPVALYTTYHEVWRAVRHLAAVVQEGDLEHFSAKRGLVS